MNQEQKDFEYFRDFQLHDIDFATGMIHSKSVSSNKKYHDVGSINPDGYERIWCNGKLRMKHRLIYFLYYSVLPGKGEEIDHLDKIRHHNSISNLRILGKSLNNTNCLNRKIPRYTHKTIHDICIMLSKTNLSDQIIADKYSVSRATVRDIKTRRSRQEIACNYEWAHRGY